MGARLLRRQLSLLLRGHGSSNQHLLAAQHGLVPPGCQGCEEQINPVFTSFQHVGAARLLASFTSSSKHLLAASEPQQVQLICSIAQLRDISSSRSSSCSQLSSCRLLSTSGTALTVTGEVGSTPVHAVPEQQQQQQQQQSQEPSVPDSQAEQQQQQQQEQLPSVSSRPTGRPVAAYGPRRVSLQSAKAAAASQKREGIIHVNSTLNNTIMVLTDKDHKVKTWTSGGTIGYKNANKATPMAAEQAAKELARRALEMGFHSVVVKLKGAGKNKQFAVQSLASNGLTLTQLQDVTPIAYNGCRLPRRRRV